MGVEGTMKPIGALVGSGATDHSWNLMTGMNDARPLVEGPHLRDTEQVRDLFSSSRFDPIAHPGKIERPRPSVNQHRTIAP